MKGSERTKGSVRPNGLAHLRADPKGFGFVEMGSDQEAQAAIQALNGKEWTAAP